MLTQFDLDGIAGLGRVENSAVIERAGVVDLDGIAVLGGHGTTPCGRSEGNGLAR